MTSEQKDEGKQGASKAAGFMVCFLYSSTGSKHGFMICCCHLDILNDFFNKRHLHFILGPANDVAGLGPEMSCVIVGGRAPQADTRKDTRAEMNKK